MKQRRKRKKNIKKVFFLLLLVLLVVGIIYFCVQKNNIPKIVDYSKYYSEIVKVKYDTKLYINNGGEYIENGIVYRGTLLKLEKQDEFKNKYFKISSLDDDYYIEYDSVEKSDDFYTLNDRYKQYIPFNKNIVTNEETTFYYEGKPLFKINKSYNLPIIISDDDKYYVEYENMLMYIVKDDVKEIIDNTNTKDSNTKGIAVLNYHFVYSPNEETCDQVICHPEKQFREHLSYIKENNFFTPTMKELEMYIDGKIQLPKSVVITLDDGRNINFATQILEEYQLNATAFIVTSRYNVSEDFKKSDYVELQSHSHNLHDVGTCPSGHGQGGGLTCLSDDVILKDLKESRDILNGVTAFCYPFYEYNSHSIELLKEAGFTMAFGGEYEGGQINVKPGINKFKIPRWVMVTYTTMNKFISYLNGGQ